MESVNRFLCGCTGTRTAAYARCHSVVEMSSWHGAVSVWPRGARLGPCAGTGVLGTAGSRAFPYACLLFTVSVYLLGFQPSLLVPVTVLNSGVLTPLLFLCLFTADLVRN